MEEEEINDIAEMEMLPEEREFLEEVTDELREKGLLEEEE